MTKDHSGNPEKVEKYISGQLSGDEAEHFELHYFECDECLASVQAAQAIQYGPAVDAGISAGKASPITAPAALPKPPPKKIIQMPVPGVSPSIAAKTKPSWLYPLAAAAAIVLAAVVGWRMLVSPPSNATVAAVQPTVTAPPNDPPKVIPPVTETAKPVETPKAQLPKPAELPPDRALVAANRPEDLVRLGAVGPLPYGASVMRGSGDDEAALFRTAMESYTARNYRQAATNLSQIPVGVPGTGKPDEHVTDAGIQLYLGVSRLMLGQTSNADLALRRAVLYGDTPYLEGAEYYLAKALIREKQYTEAAAQLRKTIALNGDRRNAAQQLLEELNKIAK